MAYSLCILGVHCTLYESSSRYHSLVHGGGGGGVFQITCRLQRGETAYKVHSFEMSSIRFIFSLVSKFPVCLFRPGMPSN